MYRPSTDERLFTLAIAFREIGMDPLSNASAATILDSFALLLLGAAVPYAWARGARARAVVSAVLGVAFAALGPSNPRPMGPFVRAFHVAFALLALAYAAWPVPRRGNVPAAMSSPA